METIGYRDVQLDKLTLDGSFKKRLKADHVKALSLSIESEIGMLNAPIVRVVRGKPMELLAGNDRVAAHKLLGREKVPARLVKCTDAEARQIVAAENAYRRHDPQEQRQALLELTEQLAADIQRTNPEVPKSGQGRRKTAKGMAREMVAKERGVTPESIRVQEYRDKKAKQPKAPAPKAEPAASPINPLGMDLSDEWVESINGVMSVYDEAVKHMAAILRGLTSFSNGALPKPKARLDRIRETLQEASDALRALIPEMLCPFCKGVEKVAAQCSGCETAMYITRSQVETGKIPPQYLEQGDKAVVLFEGKMLPLASFLVGPDAPSEVEDHGVAEDPADTETPSEFLDMDEFFGDPSGDQSEEPADG